jgi:uncharacterized protein YjbI with pentapeptide repeats
MAPKFIQGRTTRSHLPDYLDRGTITGMPGPDATEQDARNATVAGVEIGRRAFFVGSGIAIVSCYLGIAGARNYFPFSNQDSQYSEDVSTLASNLSSPSSETRHAAVAGLIKLASSEQRPSAIAALTSFTSAPDHASIRLDGRTPELDVALEYLGQQKLRSKDIDLRYADLSWIDVRQLQFPDGLPLYSANLANATITDSVFGGSNAGNVDLSGAWLGACQFTGVNFINANFSHTQCPGTTFNRCQFSRANFTGANFSQSIFNACDFDGRTLASEYQDQPIQYPYDQPPSWPDGFDPIN